MLQPVGNLPAAVYWRRRAVVVAAVVATVSLVVWLLSGAASGEGNGGQPAAAAETSSAPASTAEPIPTTSGLLSAPAPAAASPTATAPAPTSAPNPSATVPAPPPASPPAPEPAVCGDDVIGVSVATDQPEYAVGSSPKLILSVVNNGAAPCKRDLDAAKQELLIYNGDLRMWSSNDCYPGKSNDVRVLSPGQPVNFEVIWSGLASEPTCTQPRPPLPAGTYTLRARLDQVLSPDAAITLR